MAGVIIVLLLPSPHCAFVGLIEFFCQPQILVNYSEWDRLMILMVSVQDRSLVSHH